jgi:hypothetical protein
MKSQVLFSFFFTSFMMLYSCGGSNDASTGNVTDITETSDDKSKKSTSKKNNAEGIKISLLEFLINLDTDYSVYGNEYDGKTFTFEYLFIQDILNLKDSRIITFGSVYPDDTWDNLSELPKFKKQKLRHSISEDSKSYTKYYIRTTLGKNYRMIASLQKKFTLLDPKLLKISEVKKISTDPEWAMKNYFEEKKFNSEDGFVEFHNISKETVPLYKVTGIYNDKRKDITITNFTEMK